MDLSALKTYILANHAEDAAARRDSTIKDAINAQTDTKARESITAQELFEATDLAEYAALTAAQREIYRLLLSLGTLDVKQGANARAVLQSLFPEGSDTRNALVAVVTGNVTVSLAVKLFGRNLTNSDISAALTLG